MSDVNRFKFGGETYVYAREFDAIFECAQEDRLACMDAERQRDQLLEAIEAHRLLWDDTMPVRQHILEAVYKQDQALYELADQIKGSTQLDAQPRASTKAPETCPKGLRYSERQLWESTDDDRVREVLARLARYRAALGDGSRLQELLAYLDGLTADVDETQDYREGWTDCREDVERFFHLQANEEKGGEDG